MAYGKALQYQSQQNGEQVTELELNISNSGDNEKAEAPVEKQKDLEEFVLPKHIEPKSRRCGKRSRSALMNGCESKSKSKRKRNSSIVTRSQSVQRQPSQAREEENKEPELPFYALLPKGLTLTRLKGGQ